jgi:hypothetical protein
MLLISGMTGYGFVKYANTWTGVLCCIVSMISLIMAVIILFGDFPEVFEDRIEVWRFGKKVRSILFNEISSIRLYRYLHRGLKSRSEKQCRITINGEDVHIGDESTFKEILEKMGRNPKYYLRQGSKESLGVYIPNHWKSPDIEFLDQYFCGSNPSDA